MTDLTQITTAFGLLDDVYGPKTAAALQDHGGPYEVYTRDGWAEIAWPVFCDDCVYRVKPQSPKPREGWCYLTHMFATEEEARGFRARVAADHGEDHLQTPITHWREVLPE